jgi:hypothetical protein
VTRTQTTVAGDAFRLARRFGWGIADQALSSVTNFAIGIVALPPHAKEWIRVIVPIWTVIEYRRAY